MAIVLVVAAYLLGSVPFGLLIGRRYGVDVREVGSGNIGATNVWRSCGPRAGLLVLALDIGKGWLPCCLAVRLLPGQDAVHVLAGALAIGGHSFSPWLGFRGGKGVATSLGVTAALLPVPAVVALAVFVVLLAATRYVSLASLVAAVALGVTAQAMPYPAAYRALAWFGVALIWVRHRANLGRLLRGEEHKFSARGGTPPEAEPEPDQP